MGKRELSPEVPAAADYDDDFFAWTQHTASLLRAGRLWEVDVEHLTEEKWQIQRDRRGPSWNAAVVTQRAEIEAVLRDSPSLRSRIASELTRNYQVAVDRVAAETGLPAETFPATCPWTAAQLLDKTFLPD